MTVSELVKKLNLTVSTGSNLSAETDGIYTGDLLSHVMSKAQAGNIWLTVQTNINIVAVASLCDVACVVIPESIAVDAATLKKAEAEEVVILSTSMTVYEFITEYNKL